MTVQLEKGSKVSPKQIQYLFGDIAKSITSSLDFNQVVHAAMQQIDLYFQPHYSSMLRLDEERQELYFLFSKGMPIEQLQNIRLRFGEGIAGFVAQEKKSVIIFDAQTDARVSRKVDELSGIKTQSIIAVPIMFQSRVLGVIELINTLQGRPFNEQELSILETIAEFTAIALSNALSYERILWYAQHDPLTGVFSRMHLNQLTDHYVHGAGKSNKECDVVVTFIDINKLKKINDTYGHKAGDQAIIDVAEALKACCRKNDYIYRIGGDEFLLLSEVSSDQVQTLVQRLREKLLQLAKKMSVNFSFGIAVGARTDIEKLIKQADADMYAQKHKERSD